jgi:hypothetical protein
MRMLRQTIDQMRLKPTAINRVYQPVNLGTSIFKAHEKPDAYSGQLRPNIRTGRPVLGLVRQSLHPANDNHGRI